VGLDQRLPLSDQRPELVGGEVHSVEVGQTVLALNLIDTELDFTESLLLILIQIGKRKLNDTTFQGIVGILHSG